MIGMFSYQQNQDRMDALDSALTRARQARDHDAVKDLEADRSELLAWFRDHERITGGAA